MLPITSYLSASGPAIPRCYRAFDWHKAFIAVVANEKSFCYGRRKFRGDSAEIGAFPQQGH
jgi:hypothetical protein